MAFIVEDGTGVIDANAYAAVVDVDAYHLDRNNTDWTGTTTVKEAAIIKATDYIDRRFGAAMKGSREFPYLEFPRLYLCDRAGILVVGIPKKLIFATAEYALRALTETLFLAPVVDETGLRRLSKREKVGPIEEEVRYAEANSVTTIKPFPIADYLLSEYLTAANRAIRN